jgi:hypothetical protein
MIPPLNHLRVAFLAHSDYVAVSDYHLREILPLLLTYSAHSEEFWDAYFDLFPQH